jgi:hypothetical protein
MSGYSRSVVSVLFCILLITTVLTYDAAACECPEGGVSISQEYWRTDVVFPQRLHVRTVNASTHAQDDKATRSKNSFNFADHRVPPVEARCNLTTS